LIVSENGLGKRTYLDEFTTQHRGGKGVKCYKITEKTGNVVGEKAVNDDHEIMMITTEGVIIQIPVGDISIYGRNTSGVKLINLDDENVKVAKIAKVREKLSDGTQEFEDVDEALDKVVDEPVEGEAVLMNETFEDEVPGNEALEDEISGEEITGEEDLLPEDE